MGVGGYKFGAGDFKGGVGVTEGELGVQMGIGELGVFWGSKVGVGLQMGS